MIWRVIVARLLGIRSWKSARILVFTASVGGCLFLRAESGPPWVRHTIDNSSRGADGVRLADANGDGLSDIVTGWEEGGLVRVYLNPGPARAREKWPAVTVGREGAVEDAVLADLDGDGALDVVSSCEGKVQTLLVHWAPREKARYLEADAWQTEAIPAAKRSMQWMFCLPLQVDGKNGVDLVAGGKNTGAQVGWFEAPENPRHLADWKWHPWRAAGWIMSLAASDMDGDGDFDVVASDRKGPKSGCFWLENPGPGVPVTAVWREHTIGGAGREVMFLTLADLDRDGRQDVVAAVQPRELHLFQRRDHTGQFWEAHAIVLPESAGWSKAVSVGDINLDGNQDIAFTCERAVEKSGVQWLSCRKSIWGDEWESHEISGRDGVKHDLLQLIDLDGDGDLDALTCEETKNLGVFWYENPARHNAIAK